MTEPCGCKDNYVDDPSLSYEFPQKGHNDKCPVVVNETVAVQAEVIITPDVRVGEIKYVCKDGTIVKKCFKKPPKHKKCTFDVVQKICVEIPLTFSATADAIP